MTLSSYRRAKTRQSEPTQQLIVFRVLQEWFALPIRAAYKVIQVESVYGMHQGGIGLTRYQDRDVTVIDVQSRIFAEQDFGEAHPQLRAAADLPASHPSTVTSHLLLIQSAQGELIGIPLNTFPSLRRVPESAFAPVPPMYLAEGRVRCVSALIKPVTNEPPTFLLNLKQLVENQTALSAATETS